MYGQFRKETTVDMRSRLSKECNGKQECTYKFDEVRYPMDMQCKGQSQLISTYTCIPKGSSCQ